MSRGESRRTDLRRKLVLGIVLDTGTRESLAEPYVEAVMRVLDNERAANGSVYVGSLPRQYDALQIAAALERGSRPSQVCKTFGISRRQLNRLFPGGLPMTVLEVKKA